MIELRTLGPVDLRRSTGVELRAVLQQPKRVALLAYLAIARPGKLMRRDSLIALFWPDLDQEHARAALRRALYFLRQACGDEVITGRGDEEVGIAEGALWCDAVAFDHAVARNDWAQAMELYQGDLLEGFYVAGAPEVEAWLDRERAARREAAGRAAWNQAWASLPDAPLAHGWARRALELAPYDEKAIRAYLDYLDRDGDRWAALRLYDEFARRLQADLALEPADETRRLVERLRAVAAAPRVSAGHEPAATTTGRAALVVACPFAVHGDPAFAYLRDGLVSLVST